MNRRENDDDTLQQLQQSYQDKKTLRQKKRRKEKKRRTLLLSLLLLLVMVSVGFGAFRLVNKKISEPNNAETNLSGEDVEVIIPMGATTKDIAVILKEKGLIKSTFSFRMESKMNKFDGTYRQGTYLVKPGMTHQEMMELFQKGGVQDERLRLVVPEGFTTADIAARLEEKGICTAQEFIEEANNGEFDFDFVKDLPDREYRLEGYLFPYTYFLSETTTAHDLIVRMLGRFEEVYQNAATDSEETQKYTMDEIVTMASIIESEIRVEDERKIASGVIRNRLEAGMPLQMDATVLYAMGITKEDVLEKDLQIDSPYNTYKNKGLPIGPISNPGAKSLEAALHPDENAYLYYVLEAKGQSNHVYTETYEEFLKAKEKYKASK
ncbi:MAG: endolytic transglycosylase MltG [Epulopiscium sp.]|nr:endolytic transglycosylase MltG [Candidatus Epulonipiscium sp.]